MAENPEIKEIESEEVYPRFTEENLYALFLERNGTEGVSSQLVDGSELLSLSLISSRRSTHGFHFADPEVDIEFDFLDVNTNFDASETKRVESKELRDGYPIAILNRQLKDHWKLQSTSFESKIKIADEAVMSALKGLDKQADNYGYRDAYDAFKDITGPSVVDQKEFRTRCLLADFEETLTHLDGIDIWLRANQGYHNMAAQLAGFTVHGTGFDTFVEPLVYGMDGKVGLLPARSSVTPQVFFRVKEGELVNDQLFGKLAA